jgi:type II secretion system protein G
MTSTRLLLARQLMNRLAKRSRKGFTLIELLVVVVIIGILASVALPSFVGAQDKARNASVQSNARTIQMALEEFSTENNGAYPATGAAWSAAGGLVGTGTTYLPGGKIPLSPWATGNQTTGLEAVGTVPSNTLATADVTVAASPPQALPNVTKTVTGTGMVSPIPSATTHYGAVAYDYHAATQYYVLYTVGKKGKDAILVAAISNAGQ